MLSLNLEDPQHCANLETLQPDAPACETGVYRQHYGYCSQPTRMLQGKNSRVSRVQQGPCSQEVADD